MTDRETVIVSPTPELRTQMRLTLVRDSSACEIARAGLRMPARDHARTAGLYSE